MRKKPDCDEMELNSTVSTKPIPAKPPRLRAKPAKRNVSDHEDDPSISNPSKRPRINSTEIPVVAEPASVTKELDESQSRSSPSKGTSENKSAKPQVGKGWKGYALVDVEELNAGSKVDAIDAKVSSQESNGRFKLRKSKRSR